MKRVEEAKVQFFVYTNVFSDKNILSPLFFFFFLWVLYKIPSILRRALHVKMLSLQDMIDGMKIFQNKYIIVVLIIISFCACHRKDKSKPQPKVDEVVVKQNIEQMHVHIHRYDVDLWNINRDSILQSLQNMQSEYAFFLGDSIRPEGVQQIKNYLNDPIIKKLYKEVQNVYADCNFLEQAFDSAFALLQYHFPNAVIPQIYTAITGLYYEMPIMFYDTTLVIALDLYLGSNYKMYKQLGPAVPQYVYHRFSKEYILSDCFKEMAFKYIEYNQATSVLDEMLIEGKRMMFASVMLPNVHDTLIYGVSRSKLQWAVDNEADIWSYIVNQDLLYSKNKSDVRTLIGEAPFTACFGNQSPGRIGAWIGWNICRAWVKNNPDKPIRELMQEKNSQKILKESKYKPQK